MIESGPVQEKHDKFTAQKQLDCREIINPILSEIQKALILHRLKFWSKSKPETGQLAFDENRHLIEYEWNTNKRWPENVSGKIEDINIKEMYLRACKNIDTINSLEENEKTLLKINILEFIKKEFRHEKFTAKKQWDCREIINPILSEIQKALILHRLKFWNEWKPETGQLTFNENWCLIERKWNIRWPESVLGKIEDIKIWEIYRKACKNIDTINSLEENEKTLLKINILEFINKEFRLEREKLEKKEHLPYKRIRKYYTNMAKSLIQKNELTIKEWMIYREICLTLANILYSKNPKYIHEDWEISQEWLKYIWKVFLKTIKHIHESGSSKSFYKIFHDWDFNFLQKENSLGDPIVWTIDHYVRAIMYLMDYNAFNAYAEWWENWTNERYKTKKSFLNSLLNTVNLEEDNVKEDNVKYPLSDKWILHKKFSEIRKECVEENNEQNNRDCINRKKSEWSILLKLSRTWKVTDESWIRAIYYWDMDDKDWIKNSIISIWMQYLKKICNIKWITITSIQFDIKWNFVKKNDSDRIISFLREFLTKELKEKSYREWTEPSEITIKPRRERLKIQKNNETEWLYWLYSQLTWKRPQKWLQQAYQIANWSIVRWNNWKYEDFKILVEYTADNEIYNKNLNNNEQTINSNTEISQEISFYPHDNDIWIWNHNFLDLEKRIFNRVKNMDDPDLWKSISLNRLRYFIESAIKDISFEIDIYEDKIKRWLLPKPKNDDYKYLKPDWKYIIWENLQRSLQWLTYRTKKNNERFNELICIILNYFIRKNKIFYINREEEDYHGLIKPKQLFDKSRYKLIRFTTSDTLKNIALDPTYANHTICLYTDTSKNYWYKNFEIVRLGDLWDLINLEDTLKS